MEKIFVKEAMEVNITQVVGHSFNPGIRISMYNAMPVEGVSHLVKFMREFRERYPIRYDAAKM